ncbi:hypothetical protein HK098_000661 [Nowakowskiella sp. JEL0407]|nr:hypothetical protein HK098_000661 [Nowakowskiella sp. JEL0407]
MAVSRYLERKIQILLVLFLEKGEEDFAFGSVPGHETVAEGCIRSFKEIWTELSKHDMEALDTCITTLVPITSHSAPSISADPLGPSNPTNEPETSHPTDLIDEPRVFIGREDVLRFLSISFSDTTKGAAAILHGGPGIGKTTVSSHYATSSSENSKYTIAIWISLVSEFTFQEDVKRWCEVLRIPLDDDFEIVRSKFFAWLKQNRGYLIVFDNADDEKIVKSCLGKLTKINGHTLITTRNPAIDEFIPLGVDINRKFREEIKIWPDNVTREYVKYRLDSRLPKSDSENQYLDKIMEFLNGYPLLVEQMCSFLANGPGRSLKKYHELLESKDPKIFNQRPESATSRYERTIDATFGIVIDDFKKSGNRAACVLLGAIGCVSNTNIPIETYLAEYLIQAGIDTDVYDVVSTLLKVSLLKMGQDGMSVSIHLAMQDVIRRTLASTDYLDCGFNELAISVMDSIIPKENSNRTFEPSTLLIGTHLLPHISELYTTTKLQTSELADLLFCAGDFSDHIGNYNMARTLFSSSIKISTFVNGSRECADVSTAINYLGDIAKTLGDYVEARKLYNESIEIDEKVYGTRQHAEVSITITLGILRRSKAITL